MHLPWDTARLRLCTKNAARQQRLCREVSRVDLGTSVSVLSD